MFDAALRRAGAVRVRSFVELFSASKCLAPLPPGGQAARHRHQWRRARRAGDRLGPRIGLQLGRLSAESVASLGLLPPRTSMSDLIDLSSEAGPEHFSAALQAVARDPGMDGALVIFSPQLESDALETARAIAALQPPLSSPCWPAGWAMPPWPPRHARCSTTPASPASARPRRRWAPSATWPRRYERNQQLLQQTPPPMSDLAVPDIEGAPAHRERVG